MVKVLQLLPPKVISYIPFGLLFLCVFVAAFS